MMSADLDSFLSYAAALKAMRLRGIVSGDFLPEENEEVDLMMLWAMTHRQPSIAPPNPRATSAQERQSPCGFKAGD